MTNEKIAESVVKGRGLDRNQAVSIADHIKFFLDQRDAEHAAEVARLDAECNDRYKDSQNLLSVIQSRNDEIAALKAEKTDLSERLQNCAETIWKLDDKNASLLQAVGVAAEALKKAYDIIAMMNVEGDPIIGYRNSKGYIEEFNGGEWGFPEALASISRFIKGGKE